MSQPHETRTSQSIADQLTPLPRKTRGPYSTVRPVCQSTIEVRGDGSDNDFATVRGIVLDWVNTRAGRPLPAQAWQGESFELEEVGSQRVAAISIEQPRYWAARLDDSDGDVPRRSWVNEVSIADRAGKGILLGARLLCVTRGEDPPFQPSIQRFLRSVVERMPEAFVEGRRIGPMPWVVQTETDVEELTALLENAGRRLDVILCALPDGSEDPAHATINALEIHRRTYGAAHVGIITASASFMLTDRVGKEFSTFRGAVRSYRQGFDPNQDEPFRHPLGMPSRIIGWPEGGTEAYERFIVGQALLRSAGARDAERLLPPFTEVRRVAAQLKLDAARQSGSSDSDLLTLAELELKELRDVHEKDKETYQGLVEQYERERDQASEEAQQVRAANAYLRHRIKLLEDGAREYVSRSPPIPEFLEDLEVWCRDNLSGTVDVHNRALQAAKKSRYEDEGLIYQSLILLRDFYVPMKRDGGIEKKNAFDAACRNLGLSEEATFSGDRWGEEGDEYRVRYSGRPCLLDRHLKKGNSKDQRYCFRLYFFWDEESEQAVVGWLPSHLDTRMT